MTTMNESAPDNITIEILKNALVANKKVFSTGSVGYYASGKVLIEGQVYQSSINLTLVGSKPV
jgi:hypothetical protein